MVSDLARMQRIPCSRCNHADGIFTAGDGRAFCKGCMVSAVDQAAKLEEDRAHVKRMLDEFSKRDRKVQ